MNAGGGSYTVDDTTDFHSDAPYSSYLGNGGYIGGFAYDSDSPIANTDHDTLYQTERYGTTEYRYSVLLNGTYSVKLHFAEFYWESPDNRKFHVSIEGQQVLTNYDIIADVGKNTAVIKEYNNIIVDDGYLNITFDAIIDSPKISALEVLLRDTSTTLAKSVTQNSLVLHSPQNNEVIVEDHVFLNGSVILNSGYVRVNNTLLQLNDSKFETVIPLISGRNIIKIVAKDELSNWSYSDSLVVYKEKLAEGIHQNYPNPFNMETIIRYYLQTNSDVEISIYNTMGQKLITLYNNFQKSGIHKVKWDGRDYSGNLVASGLYFVRMKYQDKNQVKRLLFLK